MSRIRNWTADVLEEAARGRRASSKSSAAVGKILKHFGLARVLEMIANLIRKEEQ
ncbi:MAG: hypothetical protein ABEH81_04210 [Halopenitus sp.]